MDISPAMSRHTKCVRGVRLGRVCLWLCTAALASACGGGGGGGSSNSASTNNNTGGSAPPSLSLTASSSVVTAGSSVTLQWNSSNADSCDASGAWSGGKPVDGSEQVGPLNTDATFSLSCSGAGGASLREVTVRIDDGDKDVSVSLDVADPVVLENGQTQISWTALNADRCEASGDWSGEQAVSGSYTTPPLASNATFQLTCTAGGDSAVALVTVEVTDKTLRWQAPTENVDGTPLDDLAGFNVYWGSSSRNYTGSQNLGAQAREWEIPLGSGTYYLALTALDAENNESSYSNEVRKIIP